MKTVIKLIIATILCVADLSAGNLVTKPMKDPYHLTVEGKFLNEKHIVCTIYMMDQRGVFVRDLRMKCKKYYSFVFDIGRKYIVRFEDKNSNVKFLMVDVTRNGYFIADVDFSKKYDAKLYVTKNGYTLMPLTASGNPETIVRN